MKKLLFLIAAVSTMLIGCAKQEDMSSPPASTNAPSSGATTN